MSKAPAEPENPVTATPQHNGDGAEKAEHPRLVDPQGHPIVEQKQNVPFYRRPVVVGLGAVLFVGILAAVVYWWFFSHGYENTDDAFVTADVTSISPQVAGHVMTVAITDNQDVTAKQLLVQIDPVDFQIALSNAQTQVEVAQGQLAEATSQVAVDQAQAGQAAADVASAQATDWQAHSDLERYKNLSNEAVSRQQLDQATATAQSADASLKSAKDKETAAESQVKYAQSQVKAAGAQVANAEVAVQNAKQQLSYTTISAPIDGTVTSRSVNVGDYVQIGQVLLSLVPHEAYVIANFKETQLAHMQPGQRVSIKIDAIPGRTFNGKVDSIERGTGAAFSLLPPENATGNYVKVVQRVPVKIVFDPMPADIRLAPGMSVEPDVDVRSQ